MIIGICFLCKIVVWIWVIEVVVKGFLLKMVKIFFKGIFNFDLIVECIILKGKLSVLDCKFCKVLYIGFGKIFVCSVKIWFVFI